ncbi:MAG TPA: beta-ribofuranosylaminobenzene 5'-phosphate synthase family protein [Pirellulales bacterium]|jgi:beta-RFAP synthase|nr:beta-ribofuranosylaminobenzene 5'-phosphate synthase family protein [Pirellulales bacterium]
MSQAVVRVTAPSRLHFGMFSFGQAGVRQFGGVGAMIAEPGIRLQITAADRVDATGPLARRGAEFARTAMAALRLPPTIGCRIEIESAPREHIGLGTGTQLGLAIAAGINALFSLAPILPEELARIAGRCQRSSIGTHGFAVGGLLVEAGRYAEKETATIAADGTRIVPATFGQISPLVARVELPAVWRFLLLVPKTATGLFGEQERRAFARIPPVPIAVTEALSREALLNLVPAAIEGEFTEFSRSLGRYGQLAGSCFASLQHGAFLDHRTAELADLIRRLGLEGVGQSSWGPTLFAAVPDEAAGHDLRARLAAATDLRDFDCVVARPDNSGAQIDIERFD